MPVDEATVLDNREEISLAVLRDVVFLLVLLSCLFMCLLCAQLRARKVNTFSTKQLLA